MRRLSKFVGAQATRQIALHFAHYNFCRVYQTFRMTPAMEAVIADHVWSIEGIVGLLERKRRGPMKKSLEMTIAIVILVGAAMMKWSNVPVSGQTAAVQTERVTVTVLISYRQDRRVLLGADPVAADVLQQRVRQLMETQKTVFLSADRDITWDELMEVMDVLKAAGAEQVAINSN